MTSYQEEMRQCQVVILARAVIATGGNVCKAAEIVGVHRNTIDRALRRAGYNSRRLKQLARDNNGGSARRKPVQPALPAIKEFAKLA